MSKEPPQPVYGQVGESGSCCRSIKTLASLGSFTASQMMHEDIDRWREEREQLAALFEGIRALAAQADALLDAATMVLDGIPGGKTLPTAAE